MDPAEGLSQAKDIGEYRPAAEMNGCSHGMNSFRSLYRLLLACAIAGLALLADRPRPQEPSALVSRAQAQQTADIMQDAGLAERLYNEGKYREALVPARRALEKMRTRFGENHPNHALMLNFIAGTHHMLREMTEAETLYRRAIAGSEKARGPEHPEVANGLVGLGEVQSDLARNADAEASLRRALAIREKALGREHADVASVLIKLAGVVHDLGRLAQAAQLYERALAIREKALGADDPAVATALGGLAVVRQFMGRHQDAESLHKRSLAIREKKLGADHLDVATSAANLADLYRNMGRFSDAEPLAKRALAIREKRLGQDHPDVARSLSILGSVYFGQSRHDEAEAMYKRALLIREKSLGPDHPDTSLTLNNLASLYNELGRHAEAEPLYLRTAAIREKTLGRDHAGVGEVLGNLGVTYRRLGRDAEAEKFHLRALAVREKALGANHPDVASSLNNIAVLYEQQGRHAEADKMFRRALAAREKALPADHPDLAVSLSNLGRVEIKLGGTQAAEPLYNRALAIRQRTLGQKHPDVAESLGDLAHLHSITGRVAPAVALSRRAMGIITEKLSKDAGNGPGLDLSLIRDIVDTDLSVLRQALADKMPGVDAAAEAFEAAQWMNQSAAAIALNQMAARSGAGSDALAQVVRQQQDAAAELRLLDKTLLAELSKQSDQRNAAGEQAIRRRMTELDATLTQLNARIRQAFPRYSELVNPKPLTIPEIQKLLGLGEALLVYHVTGRNRFVWAITRDQVAWEELGIAQAELDATVQKLRSGLDLSNASPNRAFDLAAAHDLYRAVVGPVENVVISKSHLLVVGAGALTSLPFQVLLTQKPEASASRLPDYRSAPWLMLRHAVTVLPSVASLRTLREFNDRALAPQPYLGFGDPIFRRGGGASPSARKPTAEPARASPAAGLSYRDYFRRARADIDGLSRALAPLPDTADELRAFVKTLKVPASTIRLGRDATESAAKSLPLQNYRILHFATHALVAGETALFSEQSEPALALTLPDAPSDLDDGLLTSSEVATLKLNADWVILSACNTAAGDKPGAEALSGLARAFFYAGAKTLLVSHWPVQSDAAVLLTTRTIRALEQEPTLTPAEALRRAMTALLNDAGNPANADPGVWAPFVIVGTAARPGT